MTLAMARWMVLFPAALTLGEVLGIAVLILDAVAIVDVVRGRKSAMAKLIWVALILFLPVAGPLAYYLVGRERRG